MGNTTNGFYNQPPTVSYTPTYQDDEMQFDVSVVVLVSDLSAGPATVTLLSNISQFDTSNYNWTKQRDIRLVTTLFPIADITISNGAYNATLDENGRITLDAVGDYTEKIYLLIDNIVCSSMVGHKIGNLFDCNIRVDFYNSTPTMIGSKKLKPGEYFLLQGEKVADVDSIRVYVYDEDDEDLDASVVTSTTIVYDYCTFGGAVSILMDNYTSLSLGMLALIGGASIGGSFIQVEKLLPVLRPLEGTFGTIAKVIGSTAKDLMLGYASGWIAAMSMGWLDWADIIDFRIHSEIIQGIAANPASLISGVASLGANFMSGWISQGLSAGATFGVAMVVLGYLESCKKIYHPQTYTA